MTILHFYNQSFLQYNTIKIYNFTIFSRGAKLKKYTIYYTSFSDA